MGCDPFSPISLAQINVLCVPAGNITLEKFEEYIRAFRAVSVVSLRSVKGSSSFSNYRDSHVLLRVGKHIYRDTADARPEVNFNAEPQIVIGLADGESLSARSKDNFLEWIESKSSDLQQTGSNFSENAVCSLIVLGGNQIPDLESCYFVDLDGDGPSLVDVVQQLVRQFQSKAERISQTLSNTTSKFAELDGASSSITHASDRTSDAVRAVPDRANGSATGSAAKNAPVNEHNDTSAKNAVLTGQLSIQAGQWPEALRYFSDGAVTARNNVDHLWHAKALEGLLVCMLLFAWAHIDFNIPQICYPANDRKTPVQNSPSMLPICTANRSASESVSTGRSISSAHTLTLLMPQLLNTIISLYERHAGIYQEAAQFKTLCYSRVRWGNLLLVMKKHGSVLNDLALQHLVEGTDTATISRPKDSSAVSLILHVKALTKLFVDTALEAQAKIPIRQAATLQIAVASSLSILGVERKQAFHLREFLQRLGPALVEARRIGAAEVGVHPSAGMPPMDLLNNVSSETARSGIQILLESICESYGLSKTSVKFAGSEVSPKDLLSDALVSWSAAHQAGDVVMKTDLLTLCVEVSDSVPDFQCSLNLMGRLLQISVGKPTLFANVANPVPLISDGEQSRLMANIQKAVSAAVRYGMPNARARYWDKCLVRHIELSGESNSNKLMSRSPHYLSLASNTKNETKKEFFIFNPFAKAEGGAGQSVVVVGELAKFNVILQNPLQVDVEIEDMMLTAEGCDFQPDHHSIVLGPLCSQIFTLAGKALSPGNLLITGCKATIRGCHPEEFLIVQGDWKPLRTAKQMARSNVLESFSNVMLPEIKQLSLKAISPLPKLSIVSTSLLQQSIMLLEGEKTAFTLTVRNDSELEADLVLVTFEDSVTRRLEEALNNKDLLPADLYEIQNQIATRPIVRLANREKETGQLKIPKHGKADIVLELFGRPGLTDISVMVDYAYIGKAREDIKEHFYTRQLRHTITTTINGSVDIPRCSVLPLEGDLLSKYRDRNDDSEQRALLSVLGVSEGENTQCLLLLDVRNIWPEPLDVQFQACQLSREAETTEDKWKDGFTVSETLQPGQMTRVLVLVPRILITDPYTPIPSLDTKRQFVVSASKMTIEAEAASRESFWYRERLLRCLRGLWRERHGIRNGQIDMRKGIRLSSRMIDALRIDLVEVSFSLKATESSSSEPDMKSSLVTQIGGSHFSLLRNNFANLVTKVHNRSTEELRILVRLQPSLRNQPHSVALDLSKRFAWSGVLQKAIHPPLKPDETREFELGIIALAGGEYEVNGSAEEIKSRSPRTETSALEVGSSAERRVWHARRPCLIDATDNEPK